VLDEPGNGLDVASIQVVETLVRKRCDEGATVVLSSHDMGFIARVCESVLVMRGNGQVWKGAPADLVAETGQPDLHHAFREWVSRNAT